MGHPKSTLRMAMLRCRPTIQLRLPRQALPSPQLRVLPQQQEATTQSQLWTPC